MVQRKSNKRSRGEVDLTPQRQSAHLGLLDTRGTSAPRRRKSFTDGLDEDLNDEIRDLRCLEDLARLRRRKTDPPAVATRPLGWVDPLELFDEDNTMDLDAMLQSLEPKTYRNRVDGKNCAFDWTEARQRLLDTVNHGKFIYVQRRTTEVILEGTAIDMEKVPFLLMMESPEEDPKKVRENCPTHYYTKIQPSHFDPEDYIPTSLESLYDLGAAWARLTCSGQPLKAFVLASRIRPKIHAQPNEALHTPQRHTTPPAPASTPNMSISSSPVSTFGGFSTNAFGVTPTPFSTPNQNSTSPMQPPVSTFGGFSTNAFGVTPTPFSTPNQNSTISSSPVSTFGGFSTNAFGGGGSGNSDPAAHGSVKGSSSFGFLESSSSNPTVANKILAELSLVLWDRPSLQETITTWSSGMRLVYTLPQTHVTTVRKIVLDNDRGSTEEAVCQALERVWRGRNVAVQKALAWREACPLHSDTLNEALNREIKKLMRQEQKDCPEWQSLAESIPDLQDKVQAAVEERTALKEGQLEVLRYAQQLLKNGEVLSRSQWYIVKHYPKKDSSLPFRADLKVPGLGDPDLCIPEPYVFRNPLLAEGGSTVI